MTGRAGAESTFSAEDMLGRTGVVNYGEIIMGGRNRADIKAGAHVLVVRKQDQRSGKLTEGNVKNILTKSPTHPHGIKVRLSSGEIGRVKVIRE